MKKKIFSIITLLIMCVLWVNTQGQTYTDQHGVKFTYTLDGSGNATIVAVAVRFNTNTTVTVPSSIPNAGTVTAIGNRPVDNIVTGAFQGNDTIEKVYLPSTITEIKENAFKQCSELEIVQFSDNPSNFKAIGKAAFVDCMNLTSFGVGSSFSFPTTTDNISIGNQVFMNCEKLTNIGNFTIKVTSLGTEAFSGCIALNNPNILLSCSNTNMKVLPKNCFYNCTGLTSIKLNKVIKTIDDYAFYHCTSLKKVEIDGANAISAVNSSAFQNCEALESFTFRTTNGNNIGSNAFDGCKNLVSVDNMKTVSTIGSKAFAACEKLEEVDVSRVKKISERAFYGCANLKNVTFVNGKTENTEEIGEAAFDGCTKLETVKFGDDLESILRNAFNGCTNLKTVSIPESVIEIQGSAFSNAEEVFFSADKVNEEMVLGTMVEKEQEEEEEEEEVVYVYESPFGNLTTIYIPLGSYESYFNEDNTTKVLCIQGCNPGEIVFGKQEETYALNDRVTPNATWEYAAKATVGEINEYGYESEEEEGVEYVPEVDDEGVGVLDLCDYIPTRIDDLTILMGSQTKDYIIYGNADTRDYDGVNLPFRVWNKFTIKRTIPKDKYYYMSLPFDIEEGTWGDNFKVYPSDDPESDLTENYLEEEPKGGFSEDEHNPFYIYKFSSELFSQGYYNDTAFKYVKPGSEFLTGNSYAFGVDDDDDYESLTFEFSKDVESDHIDPFDFLRIDVDAIENSNPIPHEKSKEDFQEKTNLNNWIMLANPFLAAIDISSDNYQDIFSGIKYAYAFEVNEDYVPDSPEPEDKAYKLEPKDFKDGVGNAGVVNAYPHNPIYVQVEGGTENIGMGYVKSDVTRRNQQHIPAAAPRHSKIIDLALIADGEQLDHTEIKDNPTGADEYVIGEDFYKMFNSGFDEIYTMIGDSVECFANELNLQTSNRVVPLAFHIYNAGDFTLSLKNKANILDYKVYLRNLTDNSVTDLLVNDPTLHLGEGISEGDYQIEIDYAPTAVSAVENDGNSKVYVLADGLLHIDNLGSSVVSLYDATGKLLSVTDPHSDNLELTLPARGIYFVNLRGSENSTVKVVY